MSKRVGSGPPPRQEADALQNVEDARRDLLEAQEEWQQVLRYARALGVPVVKIAEAAGVSRQAVYAASDLTNTPRP